MPPAMAAMAASRPRRDRSRGNGLAGRFGPVEEQTFVLDGRRRAVPIALGLLAMPLAILVLLAGGAEGRTAMVAVGLLFLLICGLSLFQFGIWMPHRVTMDRSGLLFEAVARQVRFPWEDLEAVEPAPWNLRAFPTLRWRRSGGRQVTTLSAFPELQRMLIEVERRAPRVTVSFF